MHEMDRKELDSLKEKAKAERDREKQAAEQKYQDRLRGIELTWELASGNGHSAQSPSVSRGRPGTEGGPMAITWDACVSLSSGYSIADIEAYVVAHHASAINRKQISSALSKLVESGKIKIIKKRTGNTPALYETTDGEGSPTGESEA
jgi:hypothetical protein